MKKFKIFIRAKIKIITPFYLQFLCVILWDLCGDFLKFNHKVHKGLHKAFTKELSMEYAVHLEDLVDNINCHLLC